MDPFSALRLASNICQLLDFGGTLFSGSVQLYRSVDGASSVNSELQSITEDLTRLCSSLTQPGGLIDGQQATQSEMALISLSNSYKELREQLLFVLNSLKVKARHQRFESFRQALKSEWKKKAIHDYEERLRSYRSEIAVHLMEILRYDEIRQISVSADILPKAPTIRAFQRASQSPRPPAISFGMQGRTCKNLSRDFFRHCYTTCSGKIPLLFLLYANHVGMTLFR